MKELDLFFNKYKYITIAVIVVIVIVLIYFLIFSSKKKRDLRIKNDEVIKNANTEIDRSKITITDTQVNSIVSKIHAAMKGWGTNEKAVYSTFELIGSRSDLLQVQKVFGVRNGKTLEEYLYSELSQEGIDKINQILASKNINFIF